MRLTLLAAAALALAVALPIAGAPSGSASIKQSASNPAPAGNAPTDAKRGYWFYKKPPEPVEEEKAAETEKIVQKVMGPPPSEAELLKIPVKQVEKMIEDYREYAVYTTDVEATRWYYQMIDFARRRSRAFMNVSEVVMLNSPGLNMNTEYPTNVPGSNARIARRDGAIQQRLSLERENAALILLTSQGCGFCEAQRGILKFFQQKHGWTFREIDINQFPDAVTRFGTSSTPTTVLIVKGSPDWLPVAVGVESLPKVEENSYRAIRMLRGETTAQQWTTNEHEDGGLLDPQRN